MLGWLMPPKISLLKLTQTEATRKLYDNNHVIQDMLVPIRTLKNTIIKIDETFKIYPVWICPFKLPNKTGLVHSLKSHVNDTTIPIYVDVGIYGVPKAPNYKAADSTRIVEKYVTSVNG